MIQPTLLEKNYFTPPLSFVPRAWAKDSADTFFDKHGKHPSGGKQPFVFINEAAPGAGKTKYAAMVAMRALNRGHCDMIVYVCPNELICHSVVKTFREFGIHLTEWDSRIHKRHGLPASSHGAVLTYQALNESVPQWLLHQYLAGRKLVIFDEIHHLAETLSWGMSAAAAFDYPQHLVLGLTGTPFRSDKKKMPFAEFIEVSPGFFTLRVDFRYRFAEAVADGICRHPYFYWVNGDACIDGQVHDLAQTKDQELANQVLSQLIRPGSSARKDFLRETLTHLDSLGSDGPKKVIVFVGGDTRSAIKPIQDAEEFLPEELANLGVPRSQIISITKETQDAVGKIESFNTDHRKFLITINKVSEGVDIPSLDAAIFLSSVKTKSTLLQRIGRASRGKGRAWFYMFQHYLKVQLSEEMYEDIASEFRDRREQEGCSPRVGHGEKTNDSADAAGHAWHNGLGVHGCYFPKEVCDKTREELQRIVPGGNVTDNFLATWLYMHRELGS